jgi:hypothetical protein
MSMEMYRYWRHSHWQEKRDCCIALRSCLRTCNHNLICPRWKPLIEDCKRKLPQLNQLAAEYVHCAVTGAIRRPRLLCFASPSRIFSFKYFSPVQVLEATFYRIILLKQHKLEQCLFLLTLSTQPINSIIAFIKLLWYSLRFSGRINRITNSKKRINKKYTTQRTRKEQHSEENHSIKTMKHIKKNRVVQKTYYITGRVE